MDFHSQLNLYGWAPSNEKQVIATSDQELLLHKKDVLETGDHSSIGDSEVDVESSGCSSGHEGVASSLTTGTHIYTDSGTEAGPLNSQRTTSLDTVFPPATSLRQRNKSSSPSSGSDSSRWDRNEPYIRIGGSSFCLVKSTPNLNEGEGGTTGYSLVGGLAVWWPKAMATATGYVSLPPTMNMSPPYVAHIQLWRDKELISPTIASTPNAPSKGYVMGRAHPPTAALTACRTYISLVFLALYSFSSTFSRIRL